MAAQAHRFFVHGGLVAEDRSLGEDACLVDVLVLQDGLQAGVQLLGVGLHPLGAALLHLAHIGLDGGKAAQHVRLQLLALHGPHGHEVFQRDGAHLAHILPQLLLVHICMVHTQHVRVAGDEPGGGVVLHAQLLRQSGQRVGIALGQRQIHFHRHILAAHALHLQAQLHLAPADTRTEQLFQLIVQIGTAARDAGGILKITGVYAFDLDGDVPSVQDCFAAAVAGHAQSH